MSRNEILRKATSQNGSSRNEILRNYAQSIGVPTIPNSRNDILRAIAESKGVNTLGVNDRNSLLSMAFSSSGRTMNHILRSSLDKNLVVNGEFPNNVGNWDVREDLGSIYWLNGRLHLESYDYWARASQVVNVDIGKQYRFSGDVDSGSNGGYMQIREVNGDIIRNMSDSTNEYLFVANVSQIEIRLHADYYNSGSCSFDNISLVEV